MGEMDMHQYSDVEMARKAEKIVKEEMGRRAFAYKILDDKYGMLFDDEDSSLQAFLEGEDQGAFDGLMELVGRNGGESMG